MMDLKRMSRIIAASPIEINDYRLLPSVMVTLLTGQEGVHIVQVHPVSVVEEGPDGTHWHAIPDVTRQALSIMLSIGAAVTLVALVAMFMAHWLQDKQER